MEVMTVLNIFRNYFNIMTYGHGMNIRFSDVLCKYLIKSHNQKMYFLWRYFCALVNESCGPVYSYVAIFLIFAFRAMLGFCYQAYVKIKNCRAYGEWRAIENLGQALCFESRWTHLIFVFRSRGVVSMRSYHKWPWSPQTHRWKLDF